MSKIIEHLRRDRAANLQVIDQLNVEARNATASQARELRAQLDAAKAQNAEIDARIAELTEDEAREAAAAGHVRETRSGGWSVTSEPSTYRDPANDPTSPSFFRDLRNARLGDYAAAERLQRNERERGMERRGDLSTTANAGGQFAPPAWLVDEFVALARPGRITADLMNKQPLPSGVSSINLPKISGGATAAVQTTQNTAVSDTAAVTSSVSSGITTIAGKQTVSRQLLDQSGAPFDRIILSDLAADYAKQLDVQVLSGSGSSGQLRGLLNGASVGATTFTSASPAVTSATAANSFYNKIVSAVNSVFTSRFQSPTAIIMHPTRWSWVLEALDSQLRPLVVPDGPVFNGLGAVGTPVAQGQTGTLLGLPVYVDPNIPTNLGAGTNEDRVFVLKANDCYLYESDLRMEAFDATYADTATVLFRVLGYSAFIPDRYGPSVNVIAGTGLVGPTL